jgi:hypothetical protein
MKSSVYFINNFLFNKFVQFVFHNNSCNSFSEFVIILFYRNSNQWGALISRAEIIPIEPVPGNAGEGMDD